MYIIHYMILLKRKVHKQTILILKIIYLLNIILYNIIYILKVIELFYLYQTIYSNDLK